MNFDGSKSIMLRVIAALPLLVSSLLLLRSAYASDPSPCPDLWTHWEGFCYQMQPKPFNWQEAQAHCITIGGGFVTISSRRQLHFLSRFAEAELKMVGNLWLGCKRERNQALWFCVDGKPLYDAWGKNEPDMNSTSPAAVVLDAGEATTFDSNQTDSHHFVCQKLILPGSSTRSASLRFHRIFTDFILKGYTILATPQPESLLGCSALCLETAECVSFNLRANGQCELNTRDLRHYGDGVFDREVGSQYFEPIYHT